MRNTIDFTPSNDIKEQPVSPDAGISVSKSDIAKLSSVDIRQMNSQELMVLVRMANLPFLDETRLNHLSYADRSTLERLAFLARQSVRNQGF